MSGQPLMMPTPSRRSSRLLRRLLVNVITPSGLTTNAAQLWLVVSRQPFASWEEVGNRAAAHLRASLDSKMPFPMFCASLGSSKSFRAWGRTSWPLHLSCGEHSHTSIPGGLWPGLVPVGKVRSRNYRCSCIYQMAFGLVWFQRKKRGNRFGLWPGACLLVWAA